MTSTQAQLDTYRKFGYVVAPDALSLGEVDAINAVIDRDLAAETPFWIEREDGHVILNAHALLAYEEMDVTMRPPTLMPLLEGILGSDLRAEEHTVHIRRPYAGESLTATGTGTDMAGLSWDRRRPSQPTTYPSCST